MYTEDDEKKGSVNVNNGQDTNDSIYSDFYNKDDNYTEEVVEKPKSKNTIKIIAILLLLIIVGVLVFFVLKKNNQEPTPQQNFEVTLLYSDCSVKVGEQCTILYEVSNQAQVDLTFTSNDPNIATVDNNGVVTGIGEGNTFIKVNYSMNGKNQGKDFFVTVSKQTEQEQQKPPVNQTISQNAPSLSLTLSDAKENVWTNKDVTINVSGKSDNNSLSLKYAINCESNCSYQNVSNNKIVVSNNGTYTVKVVATDNKNKKETTKKVTVKIDKEKPTLTLNPNQIKITSTKNVTVCAICADKVSGCKEDKVCKTYPASSSKQVLKVVDNAGNSTSSVAFDVVINKVKPTCSLSISNDGTITATVKDATKYSFDANLASNVTTKKITNTSDTIVNYYVMDASGTKGTCSINVKVTSTCRYRAGGACYKDMAKINLDKDKCNGSVMTWSNGACYIYANPGMTYTYSKK